MLGMVERTILEDQKQQRDLDEIHGKFCTDAPINLFKIVNQQLSIIKETRHLEVRYNFFCRCIFC